jgi:hypothetical protein
VRTIFPNLEILANMRSAHGIVSASGAALEIDVYLPELKLGFEYQVQKGERREGEVKNTR